MPDGSRVEKERNSQEGFGHVVADRMADGSRWARISRRRTDEGACPSNLFLFSSCSTKKFETEVSEELHKNDTDRKAAIAILLNPDKPTEAQLLLLARRHAFGYLVHKARCENEAWKRHDFVAEFCRPQVAGEGEWKFAVEDWPHKAKCFWRTARDGGLFELDAVVNALKANKGGAEANLLTDSVDSQSVPDAYAVFDVKTADKLRRGGLAEEAGFVEAFANATRVMTDPRIPADERDRCVF